MGSSRISHPSTNIGHLSSQNGHVPVHSQSTIPVILKVAGSTRMLERSDRDGSVQMDAGGTEGAMGKGTSRLPGALLALP